MSSGRRESYRRRRPPFRNSRPIVVVMCDDTKTAPAYFTELAKHLRSKVTLKAQRKSASWDTHDEIIEDAARSLADLQEDNSSEARDNQSVWVVIDTEGDEKRQAIAASAKERGERQGLSVARSKPCFELWTLLHLMNTGSLFYNCDAVNAQLQAEWFRQFKQEMGKKAQADFSKIIPVSAPFDRVRQAAMWARAHHDKPEPDPSWTELYLLIEEVMRHWDSG